MENYRTILDRISRKSAGFNHNQKCSYCKSDIYGYSYHCLECDRYNLCSKCFLTKSFNELHSISHKVLRHDKPLNEVLDKKINSNDISLKTLEQFYSNEIHKDFKCKKCNNEQIKGLRLTCVDCFDYNVCCTCTTSHKPDTHSFLVHLNTLAHEIDVQKITKLEKEKVIYKNGFFNCKIIGTTKEFPSIEAIYPKLKTYKRELIAYNEINGENVLKMLGQSLFVDNNQAQMFILSEPMSKGSLNEVIKKEPRLSIENKFFIAAGIASGMASMHRMGFVHGSISLNCIFISDSYAPRIGYLDFNKFIHKSEKIEDNNRLDFLNEASLIHYKRGLSED